MTINDFEGGFCVESLWGSRRPCHAQTVFQAACGADGAITGKTDFFLSMYQFPASFIEQLKRTGKTAGFTGAVASRFLWFDIDREGDLSAALDDAARLAEFLVSGACLGTSPSADSPTCEAVSGACLGTPSPAYSPVENPDADAALESGQAVPYFVPDSESLSLWFSGAKGFHVGLPMAVFGAAAMPSPAFASQCKAVAVEIARLAGVTIDTAIYDRVRLFRCPNTRHGKTGLYKIPVSFWEITAVRDVAGILEWAKAPRRQVSPPAENMASVAFRADVPVMPSAVALWCAVCGPLPSSALPTGYAENAGLSPANPPAGVAGLPLPTPANPPAGRVKCQSQTLPESGAAVPRLRRETFDFIRHGAEHGRRAVTLFNAAADCTRCGWPAGAVFSVLMDVARDAGLSGFEAESQIQAGVKAGGNGGEI